MFFKQGKPGLKCNVHNLAKYKILMHKHDYKYSQRTRQEEATQIHLSTSLSQIKGWVGNEPASFQDGSAGEFRHIISSLGVEGRAGSETQARLAIVFQGGLLFQCLWTL